MALKPAPIVPVRDGPRRGPESADGSVRLAAALWNPDSRSGRWLAVAGLAAMVYGVFASLPAGQAPERRSAALALVAVGSAAFVLRLVLGPRTPRAMIVALVVQAVAGGVLGGFVPGGGLIFGYLAAYAAGRRLRPSTAAAITLCAYVPTAVIGWTDGRLAVTDLVGVFLGFAALLLAGVNQASRRRLHEQAELIVAEGQVVLEERARSAALAERARIAREMHDVLAHSLSGLVVQLEAAHLLLEQDGEPARVAAVLDRARGLARSGLDETRRALQTLRGEAVPTADLLADLEDLVTAFRSDTGCDGRFEVTGGARTLPADVGLSVYRVAQEALTNVRRHAPGSRAEVHLAFQPAAVTLTVTDHPPQDRSPDRDPDSPAHPAMPGVGSGFGLIGMRERAELLGGRLTVGSSGDGWRVELWAPG